MSDERCKMMQKPLRSVVSTVLLLLIGGCQQQPQLPEAPTVAPPASANATVPEKATPAAKQQSPPGPVFRPDQAQLGIHQVYQNGAAGEELMVEATGGGAGWLDFDRDGFIDLYLNQGGSPKRAAIPGNPSDQLFRSQLGRTFQVVTEHAAIHESGYSQGLAAGDFDNDGFPDLYVTNVGENRLFHNCGDGTFSEISAATSTADPRWSSSAAWTDLDRDGDLDLYVCNYLKFDPDNPVLCQYENGQPGMCDPHQVDPWPDELYLNLGDGSFQPVAQELGLFGEGNKALGVAVADFNDDGLPDIYVCNDTTDNFLFLQQPGFRFVNMAHQKGCAVSGYGEAQASMGVAVADYNRDGRPDLYLTHFTRESNTLYQNLGDAGFLDVTSMTGLHTPTLHHLGFGVVMADFDFDGREDVFIANGHIDDWSPHHEDYEQTPQLFTFDGRRWYDSAPSGGDIFREKFVARSVAAADFDADGDLDLACVRHHQPALILRNTRTAGNWIRLAFSAQRNNRFGIGVKVTVTSADGSQLVQQLCGGTSYCATHEPVLTFGNIKAPVSAEILWPDGSRQTLRDLNANQQLTVLEERMQAP